MADAPENTREEEPVRPEGDVASKPETGEAKPIKKKRNLVFFVLKVILGAGLVYYVIRTGSLDLDILKQAAGDRWYWLVFAFVLLAVLPVIGSVRWTMMLRAQKMEVPFLSALRVNYIGAFFNTFMPGAVGGDVVRMYGAAAGFPQRRAVAVLTVIADRVVGFFSLILLTIIAVGLNYKKIIYTPVVNTTAAIVGMSMILYIGIICLLLSKRLRAKRHRWFDKEGKVWRVLKQLDEAMDIYRGRRRILALATLLSLVGHFFTVVAIFAAARALGEASIPFRHYLFLAPLAMAVNAIPVSPGGMGQGEGFAEVLFKTQGSTVGAETFLVFRVVMMLAWSAGLVLYLWGSVKFKQMMEVEQEAEEVLAQLSDEEREKLEESSSQG